MTGQRSSARQRTSSGSCFVGGVDRRRAAECRVRSRIVAGTPASAGQTATEAGHPNRGPGYGDDRLRYTLTTVQKKVRPDAVAFGEASSGPAELGATPMASDATRSNPIGVATCSVQQMNRREQWPGPSESGCPDHLHVASPPIGQEIVTTAKCASGDDHDRLPRRRSRILRTSWASRRRAGVRASSAVSAAAVTVAAYRALAAPTARAPSWIISGRVDIGGLQVVGSCPPLCSSGRFSGDTGSATVRECAGHNE